MKVQDLFEMDTLTQLNNAREEYNSFVGLHGRGDPANVPERYRNEMDKMKAKLRAYQEQRKIERDNEAAAQPLNDVKLQLSTRKDNPTEVKQRYGASISQGLRSSQEVRNEYGGYEGIAQYITTNLNKLTNNKTEPFDIDELADFFRVVPRTIHKWLERPEFRYLRSFMPQEFKRIRR